VTVVKLAGYNANGHFLLLILKKAGGLVDPYLTAFLKVRIVIASVKLFWLCLETAVLRCSGDALQLQGKICDENAKVSVLNVNDPTYIIYIEGQGRSFVLPDLKIILVLIGKASI